MKLHQNPEAFSELLTRTGSACGIPASFVEKDYWLTSVLQALAHSKHKAITVFKGGTSLARAYKIIQRFSEDVDLALIVENLSGNQVKSRIDSISKSITQHLSDVYVEGVTSKGSRFRRTAHLFPRLADAFIFPSQVREELIVEINAFANPFPYQEVALESLISAYLRQIDRADIIEQYQLQAFTLQVLKPTRTLAEKVLALSRASAHSHPVTQLQDKIRHTYDLYCLMQQPDLQDFVASTAFFDTLRAVQADDAKNSEFQGEWAERPLSSAWIYQDDPALWQKLEITYLGSFKRLVYGPLPTLVDVRQVFGMIARRLQAFDASP